MLNFDETLIFIKEAHSGQVDKGGNPYWEHPYRVALSIDEKYSKARIIALLHDVVEDTHYTFKDLQKMGYTSDIISSLKLLTRDKSDGLTYMQWIDKIAKSMDSNAILVKYHDNLDNSSEIRISSLPEEEKSIIKRYNKSKKILKAVLEEIF